MKETLIKATIYLLVLAAFAPASVWENFARFLAPTDPNPWPIITGTSLALAAWLLITRGKHSC